MAELPVAPGLAPSGARPAIPGSGPQSLAELLDPALAARPNALALVGSSGRFSFRELDAEVARAAGALRELGIRPGDRVASSLPNDVDVAIHFLASQRLGAIWVGVQRALAAVEKAALLSDCEASLLVAEREMIEPLRSRAGVATTRLLELDAWREAVCSAEPLALDSAIDPFEPAAIGYTSGTTGVPKGAVHSQHNLLLAGAMLVRTGARPEAPVGAVLPLTLLNIAARALVSAWFGGRALVCIDRRDPEGVAEWIRRERVGSLDLVPTLALDWLANDQIASDLSTLESVAIGGGPCAPEIVEGLRKRFGLDVSLAYGMTEAPTGVARSLGEPAPAPGYCGLAVPQLALAVVDDAGNELPPGELGELCVSAAASGEYAGVYTPMLGYWGRPEATRAALRDGRYFTGDLGSIDEHGRVFVRGRRGEMIVRGGANVVPAEVECVLESHPQVGGAAVFGVADERLGERVVAAVELVRAAAVDEEQLRGYAAGQLARYKVPDQVLVLDALPRNALGKILKQELRRRLPRLDRELG